MDAFVGAGGWAYFDVPGEAALAAYACVFPFVEVNSTFYEHPRTQTVASWRRRVPANFAFAVRAHREVTHILGLRPVPAARASLGRTATIAARLRAIAIVLETPQRLAFDRKRCRELVDLLGSVDVPCPIALEARSHTARLPRELAAVLLENDVSDVVDLGRRRPRVSTSLAYGRIFGLGEGNRWEFTDAELVEVRKNGESIGASRVAYTFHGVRMYKDAGRFLTYVRTGRIPRATRQVGLDSLEEILEEAATFPATREELVREHGFRVVDLGGREVHAEHFLRRLAARAYASASDAVGALRAAAE